MARLPRVYIEGILYYVTSRGGHNQNIFRTHSDYLEYMGLMSKYKKQYGFRLFGFVLLPTHLHMLIELKNNIGLSNIMHDINSLYTKVFNSKYNTKGHLFEARYKAALAEKKSCLLDLVRHMHRNPKRERIVYDPKDYPYSSHHKYLDPKKRVEPDITTEAEEVFKMLDGRENAFAEFVNNITRKESNEMKKRLRRRILGPKHFQERIKKILEKSSYETHPTKKLKRAHKLYSVFGVAALIAVVSLSGFFSRQHTALVTEYDKSIALYDKTIVMLKTERENALNANRDAEEFAWKIRVAEESLADLKEERSEALKRAKEIDGRSWQVRFSQIGGPRGAYVENDIVSFKGQRVSSNNLINEGFSGSNFSTRLDKRGDLVWETIQTNKYGETVSWRGVWNGKTIKGVLSRKSRDRKTRDFSFITKETNVNR